MESWDYKNLKSTTVESATDKCLAEAGSLLEGLLNEKGKRTVENTLATFNEIGVLLSNLSCRISMLKSLHPDKKIRLSAEQCLQKISDFSSRMSLSPELYKSVDAVDVSGSDATTKRLKEHTLRDFRRSGSDKSDADRNSILDIRQKLVKLSMEFARNNAEALNSITVANKKQLKGIPENVLSRFGRDEEGRIVITTDYSDYFAVMQFADDESLRRSLAESMHARSPENEDILKDILRLRKELTAILGYKNWADYATEVMMTKSAGAVEDFIETLDQVTLKPAEKEASLLLEFMKKDGIKDSFIADWNRMYYSEVVKREHFEYNPQEFMNYFPYAQVKQGILDVYSNLFDIEFVLNQDISTWHDTVECYDVLEKGELLGRIYLDMHPRDGKYKHAACGKLVFGLEGRQVPESFLMCNFPGGKKSDGPALMQFGQVSTFFHEFGHLLHNIFAGKHRWVDFSGISTERDFVETPSQLLEEWLFSPQVLQRIGRHYEDGNSISEELIRKLESAENFGKALHVRRQTFLSAASYYLHTEDLEDVEIETLFKRLEGKYSPFVYTDNMHMWTSWGHLIGYSSNYYTYMWSLAIAKDLMTAFNSDNLMDKAIAKKYRETILEPGGSRDAADMVKDFLGREYSFEAFADWINS